MGRNWLGDGCTGPAKSLRFPWLRSRSPSMSYWRAIVRFVKRAGAQGGIKGRGGGPAAVGCQPGELDCNTAGRGAAALSNDPMVPQDSPSVGLERRRHRPGHPMEQPTGHKGQWRKSWSESEVARWCMPTKPADARTGPTATFGPSAPPLSGTSCAAAEEREWLMRSWMSLSVGFW